MGKKKIRFHSYCLDYHQDMEFCKITKSGRLKVKEPIAWGPEGTTTRTRYATPREYKGEVNYWIMDGTGSVYYKPKQNRKLRPGDMVF